MATNDGPGIRTTIFFNYCLLNGIWRHNPEFIVNELTNIPERWELLSFNKLCDIKYSRLGMSWILKDEFFMTKEEMEHFQKVAKEIGVKNVKWSGLFR